MEFKCLFPGCDSKQRMIMKYWCHGHYSQWYSGRELKPLARRRKYPQGLEGQYDCTKCGALKDRGQFSTSGGKPHSWCKECCRVRGREDKITRYGITMDQYEELLETHGGRCHICGTDTPGDGKERFVIDHDHNCCPVPETGAWRTCCGKCVRGLLCGPCNKGLGHFRDSPEVLRYAALYIERYEKTNVLASPVSSDQGIVREADPNAVQGSSEARS